MSILCPSHQVWEQPQDRCHNPQGISSIDAFLAAVVSITITSMTSSSNRWYTVDTEYTSKIFNLPIYGTKNYIFWSLPGQSRKSPIIDKKVFGKNRNIKIISDSRCWTVEGIVKSFGKQPNFLRMKKKLCLIVIASIQKVFEIMWSMFFLQCSVANYFKFFFSQMGKKFGPGKWRLFGTIWESNEVTLLAKKLQIIPPHGQVNFEHVCKFLCDNH